MRKILMISVLLAILQINSGLAAGQEITVKVKGLVCAFCVRNIEKSFLQNDAVEKVKADLDTKTVTINLKESGNLDDKTIEKTITDAGYNVTTISR